MRPALLALVCFIFGCGETFKPESVVADFRVLGIKAEPADLRPGDTTSLTALVADPKRAPTERTLLWLSCDPDPFGAGRNACSDIAQLQDLSQIVTNDGSVSFPPGMRTAGFGDLVAYTAPSDLFSVLAADDRRRLTGTVAQILMLAVAEAVSPLATQEDRDALLGRIQRKEVPFIASLFRIRVSEDPQRNTNPTLESISVGGRPVRFDGSLLRVSSTQESAWVTRAPASAFETYDLLTPTGSEARSESLLASYYTTVGRFSRERVSLGNNIESFYRPPGFENNDELPDDRQGQFFVVVRDTRGGQVWTQVGFYLCDASLPSPVLTSVSDTAPTPGTILTLEGDNLASVLEVVAGDTLLQDFRYVTSTGRITVSVPVLPAGPQPLLLRTKACSNVLTTLTIAQP
jgi:hypothetical protein